MTAPIAVSGSLTGAAPIGTTHVLTVALAVIIEGEPAPAERERVRWLPPRSSRRSTGSTPTAPSPKRSARS